MVVTAPAPPGVVDPDEELELELELEPVAGVPLRATVTSPFMPEAACVAFPERNSYFPLAASLTVSVAVAPGATAFVATPEHEFASSLALGFVQTLKECGSLPLFVTLNTAGDTVIRAGDTLSESSCGTPAVTVIVPPEVFGWASRAAGSDAAATKATTSGRLIRGLSIGLLSPIFR